MAPTYELRRSTRKHKKYMAVFRDRRRTIHFGDNRYEQFKDQTPLKLYSKLDHGDPRRRRAYYARHGTATLHSAKWFSHRYLW
jgi:hypothetical protein